MENSVKIVANGKNGLTFTPGTKEDRNGKCHGFYIVEQETVSMEGGFIKEEKRTAILTVENKLGEKLNYQTGKQISGQIVRSESKAPYFDGDKPVINPSSGEEVLRGGVCFYRKDEFTADLTKSDSLVPRDGEKVAAPKVGLAD